MITVDGKKNMQTNHTNFMNNNILLISIVTIVVAYILLLVIPFYADGDYLMGGADAIEAGIYGSSSVYGNEFLHITAYFMAFIIYLVIILCFISTIISLRQWRHYNFTRKLVTSIILICGLLIWLFATITPLGRLIAWWILD